GNFAGMYVVIGVWALATMAVVLLAYHFAARRTAMLDGVVRCGRCGAMGDKLRKGRCLVCEPDSGPGGAGSGRALPPKSKVGLPIPWRTLGSCAGVGAVVLTGMSALLRFGPSPMLA